MDEFVRRRQQLVNSVQDAGLDSLLVSNSVNVSYVTGFSGDSSWLVIGPRRTILVSDGRYATQISEECPGLEVHIRETQQTVAQAVAGVLMKLGLLNVGIESEHMSLATMETMRDLAKSVSWSAQKNFVENLRRLKDPSEVEMIRDAIRIAEKAYDMFRAMLTPEDTEKSLSDAMEGYVRRAGGKCTSFPTIVAVGDRSALPHAPPTQRRAGDAPFLLLDWGASGAFYKSDLTRMVALSTGDDSTCGTREMVAERLEKLYTIVLTAQKRALQAIRPGVKASDIDKAVRSYLESVGYNEYFNHGLGHGIGLQLHEAPNIRTSSEDVLEAGMVFTVEPGVYLPGFAGVRIEDDVLVTPDGCEVLTKVPKEPADVF